MVEKDNIKELFEKTLANHEVNVRPELWQGVASQIGTASVVGGGMSLLSKLALGISGAAVIATSAILLTNKENDKEAIDKVATSQVEEKAQNTEILNDNNTPFDKVTTSSSIENEENTQTIEPTTTSYERPEYIQDYVDCVLVETPLLELQISEPLTGDEDVMEEEMVIYQSHGNSNSELLEEENNDVSEVPSEEIKPLKSASITKVPNIFTPNGDRDNDEFFIEYEGELIDYQLVIMNQQNQVVYKTTNPDFRWNGMSINGEPVKDGNYYFILTASDSANNPINQYGQLTIRR